MNSNSGLEMSVDLDALGVLLRKMYTGHTARIATRELLQNALDACHRANVKPEIKLEVLKSADGTIMVSVSDNGCGMQPEDIVSKFLRIGGTGKANDASAVGGFGWGVKAVLFSAQEWTCRTLKWSFSKNDLRERKPITESAARQGTEVTILTTEKLFGNTLNSIIELVYFSDIDIHFSMSVDGNVVIDDPHAGLRYTGRKIVDKETNNIRATIYDEVSLPDFYTGGKVGHNIVRLGGLVQFMKNKSANRKTNLIFDVVSKERPESKNYPLDASREKLQESPDWEVWEVIRKHDVDNLTSARRLREPDPVNKEFDGYGLRGKRGRRDQVYQAPEPALDVASLGKPVRIDKIDHIIDNVDGIVNKIHFTTDKGETLTIKFGHSTIQEIRDISRQADRPELAFAQELLNLISNDMDRQIQEQDTTPQRPRLMLKNYRPQQRDVRRHEKLLKVWEALLVICADPHDDFGIGATTEFRQEMAERLVTGGFVYYILNPKAVENISSNDGIIMALWGLACHETAHYYQDAHNEEFAATEGTIQRESADALYESMRDLKKLLK